MIRPEFLLTAFVVVVVPGTGVIYTVSTGLMHRWRASIAAALGCALGIVPHLTASILGLSAILHIRSRPSDQHSPKPPSSSNRLPASPWRSPRVHAPPKSPPTPTPNEFGCIPISGSLWRQRNKLLI